MIRARLDRQPILVIASATFDPILRTEHLGRVVER
jgi:hypothetical protein